MKHRRKRVLVAQCDEDRFLLPSLCNGEDRNREGRNIEGMGVACMWEMCTERC